MYYVPDKNLDPPELDYFSDCDVCGRDIYVGDDYYDLGGEHMHIDCISEYRKTAGE